MSAMPLLRFDPRLPRQPWHRWQHIYMWAAFPLLQLAFQVRHRGGPRGCGGGVWGGSRSACAGSAPAHRSPPAACPALPLLLSILAGGRHPVPAGQPHRRRHDVRSHAP